MKKNKKSPFVTNYVIDAVRTALITEFAKPALNFGVEAVKSKTLYIVDISDSRSFINNVLVKIFKNYPCAADLSMYETGYSKETPIVKPQGWNLKDGYIDMTIYDSVPIFIKASNFTMTSDDERIRTQTLSLITLNNHYCRCVLNDFLVKLKKMAVDYETKHGDQVYLIDPYLGHADVLTDRRLRTFNDVFVPYDQKELLETSIDSYMSKRQWYIDNNIPNHFGILLYGSPGTGKSCVVQAIASHVNGPLYVASGDQINSIHDIVKGQMGRHAFGNNQYRVMAFEDVDSGLFNLTRDDDKKKDDDKEKKRTGLATILNALDGIGSPTNVIYVFTTNHIERLDPALIRPGRCDLKLEIPYVTHETLKQFIKFHYQTDIEIDRCVPLKENMTFAELQTRVMCGNTVEQLLDYCVKGVDDNDE